MARSAKTKHVMNLVGAEPVKKPLPPPKPMASQPAAPQSAAAEKVEKIPPAPIRPETAIEQQQQISAAIEETAREEAVREELPQEEPVQEEKPAETEKEPVHKPMITAIVCELINQELGSVAERFHLQLTDGNLWALTRAALEEVRPEFSADSEDREEKLERLRPQVIGAMAKVAIKLASKGRNN